MIVTTAAARPLPPAEHPLPIHRPEPARAIAPLPIPAGDPSPEEAPRIDADLAQRLALQVRQPRFSVARSLGEVIEAWSLLYETYLDVDFISPNRFGVHTVPQAIGSHTAVVRCRVGRTTIGTISCINDTPLGLPLDEVYGPELDTLRGQGRRLAEIGLFAERSEALPPPPPGQDGSDEGGKPGGGIMLDLLRYAFYFAVFSNATDIVCGIPPRRAKLYQRAMGFEPIGEVKSYSTVEDNPVVLLRAQLRYMTRDAHQYRMTDYFARNAVRHDEFKARYLFDNHRLVQSPLAGFLRRKQDLARHLAQERQIAAA